MPQLTISREASSEDKARAVEQWALGQQAEAKQRHVATAAVIRWGKEHPWAAPFTGLVLASLACSVFTGGGEDEHVSETPSPTGTDHPTPTSDHTPIHTPTASHTPTPAMEHAPATVIPSEASVLAKLFEFITHPEWLVAHPAQGRDTREAGNTLLWFDRDGNRKIDDGELALAARAMGAWAGGMDAVSHQGLVRTPDGRHQVPLFDKLSEFLGLRDADSTHADVTDNLSWHPFTDFAGESGHHALAGELTANSGVLVSTLTTVEHWAQTIHDMSQGVVEAVQQLDPKGHGISADQLEAQLKAQLRLEGGLHWDERDAPKTQDETGEMCLTPDNRHVRFESELLLGQQVEDGRVTRMSNQDVVTVPLRLVDNLMLRDVMDAFRESRHTATVIKVSGNYSVVVMHNDLSDRTNAPESPDDRGGGSGSQIVLCPESQRTGQEPTATSSATPTPTETERPGGGQPATEAPRPQETPVPLTDTPARTAVPTLTPLPTVRPTERPSVPPPTQPLTPEPTETPRPTDVGTPTAPPTLTDTPARTPDATLTPIPPGTPSPTPFGGG